MPALDLPVLLEERGRGASGHGTEARVKNLLVLRVTRPEIMDELRKSKAGKFLGEVLSPTAVVIKNGAESKVLAALAEMGLLAEIET